VTDFGELLRQRAAEGPAEWTLEIDGDRRAWKDVIASAFALAGGLNSIGAKASDTVSLLLDTSHEAIEAWLAVSTLGSMDVPINVNYRGELLRYLINDSSATHVVCDAARLPQLAEVITSTSVRSVVCVGEPVLELPSRIPLYRLEDLRRNGSAHREQRDARGVILYTSGTTGPSKGVLHSQASCLELARYCARMNGYAPGDTLLNFFPLYHQNARYTGVGAALVAQASMQLDSKFSSSRFWDICRMGNITAFNYLGSVLDMIVTASAGLSEDAARDHTITRAWGAGAGQKNWKIFKERFGIDLNEVYGLTEAPMATVNFGSSRAPAGSAGRSSELFEVQVVDGDDLILPAGEPGEIVVRPKKPHGFMLGYFGRDDATVAATRNLWFHTGDNGWLDDQGNLFFRERTKDSVRRRGENISLWEVESALNRQPGVIQSAAYGVITDGLDEDVMAAVVLADDDADLRAVLTGVMAELPNYAVPRFLRAVPQLPHTGTMKIQKHVLKSEGVTSDCLRLEDVLRDAAESAGPA
jgi:crotonobetaine/carnitine-CoA ligase